MKHILTLSALLTCCILSGCTNRASIGIIGGADGPTEIIVSDSGKQTSAVATVDKPGKDPVRLVKINDTLYYDTDEESEIDMHTGSADGKFQKGAEIFEIPKNNDEANFVEGCIWRKGAFNNTIEVLIGDDWEIFAAFDTNSDIDKYTYAYIVEGRLNGAHDDSEFLVLANDPDVTFNDAANKMLSSTLAGLKDIYVMPID